MRWRLGLPLAWAAIAVAILVLEALPPVVMDWRGSNYAFQDTYFVVAHWRYGVSLVAVCAVFAGFYGVLSPASPLQQRLAWMHVATFAIGCTLIFWPLRVLAPFFGLPGRRHDPLEVFAWANRASTVGYAITLLGLLVFVGFLIDKAAQALASLLRPRSG